MNWLHNHLNIELMILNEWITVSIMIDIIRYVIKENPILWLIDKKSKYRKFCVLLDSN